MIASPYLRSRIQSLRITHIVPSYDVGPDGVLSLCPRLAWSAQIAEFEWVEVRNLTRHTRYEAYVVFGEESKVGWWSSGDTTIQSGDALQVSAYVWLNPETKESHIAHLVRVGRRNAPIEIRRVTARPAPREPSFFPLPSRHEDAVTFHPSAPAPATD